MIRCVIPPRTDVVPCTIHFCIHCFSSHELGLSRLVCVLRHFRRHQLQLHNESPISPSDAFVHSYPYTHTHTHTHTSHHHFTSRLGTMRMGYRQTCNRFTSCLTRSSGRPWVRVGTVASQWVRRNSGTTTMSMAISSQMHQVMSALQGWCLH